jgi:hypothetical protein
MAINEELGFVGVQHAWENDQYIKFTVGKPQGK